MLADPHLAPALAALQPIVLHGPWYRTLAFDYLQNAPPGAPIGAPVQPLWPGGARRNGARFTPKQTTASGHVPANVGFDCLYLASDVTTALREVTGVLTPPNSPVQLIFEPQAVLTVDGVLTRVIDLTDRSVQKALQVQRQTLTGDWAIQQADYFAGQAPMPDTQRLGDHVNQLGTIVGLKFPSAKNPRGFCLLVFTSCLQKAASYVELFNKPGGLLQQRLP